MLTYCWRVAFALSCVLASGVARAQTPEQLKVLAEIKAADTDLLAVSDEDGRFLRVMVAALHVDDERNP